jgi:predicted CoA-binding protein
MTYAFQNPSQKTIFDYLKQAKTIAVVGLSNRRNSSLSGFQDHAGRWLSDYSSKSTVYWRNNFGETVYASLKDIPLSIDIVNVFRRSEFLPDVAREFIETDAKIFWAQLGLESQEAEEILRQAGRDQIVMNRCIKIEYQKMIGE